MLPYLRILIRQRIEAWKPRNMFGSRKSKVSAMFGVIAFIVGMVSLYGMLVMIEYYMYSAFSQLGEPETMLALTGIMCVTLTVITGFFYIVSELFFSKDVSFVSSLPITSRELLTAKLIRIWLGEIGIAWLICLPVSILYGINQAMGVLYYVKALLLIPFLPLVPLSIVTLLAFALIRVSVLWKRRETMTVIVSMLFLVAVMWGEMKLSMSAQDDNMSAAVAQIVIRQRSMLDMFAGLYPPIQWFSHALSWNGLLAVGNWFGFAGLNVAAIAAVIALLGGSYQRLAVRQNETLTHLNATTRKRADRHGMRSPFQALYRREVREIFSSPSYAMNCLATGIMFPVVFLIVYFSAGSEGSNMTAISELVKLVPASLITAFAAALFAMTASMNMAVSTAVSREGVRHEFFRTLPVTPQTQLLAKLSMGLTLNLLMTVPMAVIALVLFGDFRTSIIIGFIISLLFTTGFSMFGLMVDAAHPKFGWKNETEAIKQNGLAALSMFGSIGFLAACGFLYYWLTTLGIGYNMGLLLLSAVALVADLLLYKRLIGKTAQTYILQEMLK